MMCDICGGPTLSLGNVCASCIEQAQHLQAVAHKRIRDAVGLDIEYKPMGEFLRVREGDEFVVHASVVFDFILDNAMYGGKN